VGVKGVDGFQAPGLTLFAVGLCPADRLPVGVKDQPRARIGQFDAVACRFPDIQEKRALDRVLVPRNWSD
jgi:hypothetical protein